MTIELHEFDNGVRVHREHLSRGQLERYRVHNVHEVHEEAVFRRLLEELPKGATFLSVGLGIGYYVILALRLRPDLRVHALEPLERHRRWFAHNAELNQLDITSVQVYPEAIGPHEGTVAFEDDGCASVALVGTQRRGFGFWARQSARKVMGTFGVVDAGRPITRVPLVTLETLLQRAEGHADLMQMDVQGVEADVLEASVGRLREGALSIALVGTHGPEIHARSRAALQSAGFGIELDEPDPGDQPDGMLLARFGQTRG